MGWRASAEWGLLSRVLKDEEEFATEQVPGKGQVGKRKSKTFVFQLGLCSHGLPCPFET